MYHAQSFAENGFVTDLIGYAGSKPIPSLARLPRVRMRYIPQLPKLLQRLPFAIGAPIKITFQVINILLCLLVWIDMPPEFILVQNPPSIPALALVQLVGRLRGSKVIIDWHNLGYSILALKFGESHLFVRIYKWFEATFGYTAYAHLFVTKAMRDHLVKQWNLQGHKIVLYDRPPKHFHHSSTQETHELFCKLNSTLADQNSLRGFLPEYSPPFSTPLTQATSHGSSSTKDQVPSGSPASALKAYRNSTGIPVRVMEGIPTYTEVRMPSLRPDRPALLVSSTSWTPDEDFGILLEALKVYEMRSEELASGMQDSDNDGPTSEGSLPKLLVIITGKGPLKEKYMTEVEKLQQKWNWVRCIPMWLDAQDYPTLLGAADLGVCLHSSSSALDLPMKVVDMFGCGLPVCALNFTCLDELVKDQKNGLVFNNASQLASQLEELFMSFPNAKNLQRLTSALETESTFPSTPSNPHVHNYSVESPSHDGREWTWSSWEDNWGKVVRPLILQDVNL
ncbi:beta-1,4-mannosyltransferase [Crepidotus variabilis]|uniref:Chitobiosyldiphosphodolichol beta-mannosyltransferase n=1 Tax=Crepidotus variabilis TaxID=179855 RepID=A0A9P6EVB2_9AGAR|nr:beta-1,4-mannosyltransferase [Crepidotus variabilis]